MKALCVVAHPDDCVIFAWPFIDTYSNFDWTICYLTYDESTLRGSEISKFWKTKQIKTLFLGHKDTHKDLENNEISFDSKLAQTQILLTARQYNLILTHNHLGEYGHIHHKFVHNCLQIINRPKVFFGDQQEYDLICRRSCDFQLDELPLHKDVIQQFTNIEVGRYCLTNNAKEFLDVTI